MATVLCVKDNLLLVAQALLCQERYGDVSQCNYANVCMRRPFTYAVIPIVTIMHGDPIP